MPHNLLMADTGRLVGVTNAWPAPTPPREGWPARRRPVPDLSSRRDEPEPRDPLEPPERAGPLDRDDRVTATPEQPGARQLPPALLRVPLPAAALVRLPSPKIVPVTPVVARSARPRTDRDVDQDLDGGIDGLIYAEADARLTLPAPSPADSLGPAGELHRAPPTRATSSASWSTSCGEPVGWLDGERVAGVRILRDRIAPTGNARADYVLVASSGVWVVGVEPGTRVELRSADRHRRADRRLLVGGRDRTGRTTEVGLFAREVRKFVGRPDIGIHSAMCMVGAERSLLASSFRLQGVWVSSPRQLIEMVQQPGSLDAVDAQLLADLLDTRLRTRH